MPVTTPTTKLTPKIFVQNASGALLATQHLIEHGHSRIGHIGGPAGVMSAVERAEGWRRGLSEAGLQPKPAWHICSEYEIAAARVDAGRLLDGNPELTAIFAGSDASALGVMYAANGAFASPMTCPWSAWMAWRWVSYLVRP